MTITKVVGWIRHLTLVKSRGTEGLEDRWKQLCLSSKEESDIIVQEDVLLEEIKKGDNSVLEKLYVDRSISREVLRTTMAKAWRTVKPFLIKKINCNMFIFSFECHANMQRILNRRPWLFISCL